MKKRTKKNILKIFGIIIFFVLAGISSYYLDFANEEQKEETPTYSVTNKQEFNLDVEGKLQVHFIDVGQADAILVKQAEHYMLIDAGKNDTEEKVVNYLKEQKIEKFDYIVGTHAHEDHIGGLDKVIDNFEVDNILFPKQTSTTKTFESFVKSVKSKNKKLYAPVSGESFSLGDATFKVLAPNSNEYEESNDYSIVIKLTYKNKSILFMGDAEELSENEILKKGYDLKSDVIKLGHHGSRSSTSTKFLTEVSPSAAVISAGKDNDYGHPHKETMLKLQRANIPVYRTDESGTIILLSDGENISFNVKEGTYNYGR